MTQRRLIKIASRTLPLCALLLASCGGSTPGDGTGTAGTGSGTAGTSGGAGTTGICRHHRRPPAPPDPPAPPAAAGGPPAARASIGPGARRHERIGRHHRHRPAPPDPPAQRADAAGPTGTAGTTGSAAGAAGPRAARPDRRQRRRAAAARRHRHGQRGGTTGTGGTGGTVACAPPTVTLPSGNDAVVGTMIQFNDNGGWCWYQDERAVVDTKANKLVIATRRAAAPATATTEAVIYDIATNKSTRSHAAVVAVDEQRRRSQLAGAADPARRQVPRDVVRPPRRLPQPHQHLRRHRLGRGEDDRLDAVGLPVGRRAARTWSRTRTPGTSAPPIYSMVSLGRHRPWPC